MKSAENILIIGGNGFVGSHLASFFAKNFNVTATHQRDFTPIKNVEFMRATQLDNKDRATYLFQKVNPKIVIYCGGPSDHLLCELDSNVRETQIVHSIVPTTIATACDLVKAKFIYLSSDLVFSGADGNFSEDSTAMPSFALGKAKVSTENFLRGRSLNSVILRCAPLIGRGPMDHPSWLDKIREALMRGKPLRPSAHQFRNPIHISLLAPLILEVIEGDIRNKTFHVAGLSKVSDFEFAQIFASQFGFNPELIEPAETGSQTHTSDYSLNFTETAKALKLNPLSLEESLALLKN